MIARQIVLVGLVWDKRAVPMSQVERQLLWQADVQRLSAGRSGKTKAGPSAATRLQGRHSVKADSRNTGPLCFYEALYVPFRMSRWLTFSECKTCSEQKVVPPEPVGESQQAVTNMNIRLLGTPRTLTCCAHQLVCYDTSDHVLTHIKRCVG